MKTAEAIAKLRTVAASATGVDQRVDCYRARRGGRDGTVAGFAIITACRQMTALVRLSLLELWRRNEIVGLLILALAVMVPLSFAKPFGAAGATRYLDEVALLLIWGFSLFIALGTGARLFPPEFESRTILTLRAKPISLGRLVLGKYLGALVASSSAVLFFYALFVLSVRLRGGGWISVDLVQAMVLHLGFVALAVALSLLGSLVVTNSANLTLNGILLVAMFFFGRRLLVFADGASFAVGWITRVVYAIAPHAEFFDMRQRVIHGWGAVDGAVLAAVIGYAAVYVTVVLVVARWALIRRKA